MGIRDKDSSGCSKRSTQVRRDLKVKQEEYEKAEDSEGIERLVSEIEMLKFVLFLECRNESKEEEEDSYSNIVISI